MASISIIPQLKKKANSKTGTIIIRGFFNRVPVKALSTGYQVRQDHWDQQNRRVKDSAPNAALINICLQNKLQQIQGELLKKEMASQQIDGTTLAMLISGGSNIDFIDYCRQVINERKLKDGNGYDQSTKNRYLSEVKRLQQYLPKITFKEITAPWLTQYREWLQNSDSKNGTGKIHSNSIWKALSFVRMVWHEAVQQKIISSAGDPFKNFRVGKYKRVIEKIKYLKIDQIDAIEKMLIERESFLDLLTLQIGWRFLFMCVTGLRISDAWQLSDIIIKGSFLMEFSPHKTRRSGNRAQVPIANERQQRYLQKTLQFSFPKKSMSYTLFLFNRELRIIAQLAGINMHITSHVGRHSMGSFLVDGSIDSKAAQVILGVKSDEVMKTYLHLKETKLLSEASKLDAVFK